MRHIAVVGGGITGLAAAYQLSRHPDRPRVTLFEASERLGGHVRASPFAGLPAVDEGADAFLARVPWAVDLAAEVGITDLVAPATGRAYVWWDLHLHPLPEGLVLGVPAELGSLARSRLLSWPGKARAALEPLVPSGHIEPDNLGALIAHRFGAEVLDRLVDPLVGSVNAGDTRHLSLAGSAPNVAEAAAGHRSLLLALRRRAPAPEGPIFLAPANGMGALVDAIAARLEAVAIRLGVTVGPIEPGTGGRWRVGDEEVDGVVVAVPAHAAARLVDGVSPSAAAALAGIDYASVAIITLAFPAGAVRRTLDGSGHLVPKPVQRTVTAVSWASSKWAHWQRDGQVVLRASAGRAGDEHALDLDDAELIEAVVADVDAQLGLTAGPTEVRVTRWPRSFPQYAPGHLDRVAAIERAVRADAPGIVLVGAAYRGLGLPACIHQGREGAIATMRAHIE